MTREAVSSVTLSALRRFFFPTGTSAWSVRGHMVTTIQESDAPEP